LTNHKFKKP